MNHLNEILTSTSTLKQVSKQFYCNTVFCTTKVNSLLQMKHIENRANKVPKIKSLLQMKHMENRANKVPKIKSLLQMKHIENRGNKVPSVFIT